MNLMQPVTSQKYTSTAPQVDLQTHVYISQLSRQRTSTAPQVDLKRTASAPQAVASEARGQRGQLTPHILEHGVKRGQGHQISDNWHISRYCISKK